MRDLTEKEQGILNKLGECAEELTSLPPVHQADLLEFTTAIHQAQNIIMARPATEVQQ